MNLSSQSSMKRDGITNLSSEGENLGQREITGLTEKDVTTLEEIE